MEKHISNFIENQFPQFVHEYGPKMVSFIKLYYQWLEQVDNTIDVSRKLDEYLDVDRSPEKFWYFLKKEFLQGIPETQVIKKEILLKRIKDFYKSKGTEKSFEFIFKLLFNEQVEFYYPAKDILRASDGKWLVEKSVRLQAKSGVDPFTYLGKEIKGETSKAKARAERIISYLSNGSVIYEIFLSNVFNSFTTEKILDSQNNSEIGTSIEYKIYDGRYISNDGFLSDDKYLQDSYYYQEFSYELRSGQSADKYKNVVDNTVHPSGTIFFGKFYLNREINVQSTANTGNIFELELERIVDIPLIIFSNLSYSGAGDFIDIFIDSFIDIFSTIDKNITRYFPINGTVKLLEDDYISNVENYTINDLQYISIDDILNKKVLIGNSTLFTTQLSVGGLELYVDSINNDMGFATVGNISSNVALTNLNKYNFDSIPNWDKIYKGISEG